MPERHLKQAPRSVIDEPHRQIAHGTLAGKAFSADARRRSQTRAFLKQL
jgi:hypothetical protein